jgi:hypothetical protein
MAASVTILVEAMETELRAVGTPSRALHEKRYLKSDLQFFELRCGRSAES